MTVRMPHDLHHRWRTYWRAVVMGAAMSAGQIGPLGDRLAAQRETIAIVRVIHAPDASFDPRERVGDVVLTRTLDLSDQRVKREQRGGDLN